MQFIIGYFFEVLKLVGLNIRLYRLVLLLCVFIVIGIGGIQLVVCRWLMLVLVMVVSVWLLLLVCSMVIGGMLGVEYVLMKLVLLGDRLMLWLVGFGVSKVGLLLFRFILQNWLKYGFMFFCWFIVLNYMVWFFGLILSILVIMFLLVVMVCLSLLVLRFIRYSWFQLLCLEYYIVLWVVGRQVQLVWLMLFLQQVLVVFLNIVCILLVFVLVMCSYLCLWKCEVEMKVSVLLFGVYFMLFQLLLGLQLMLLYRVEWCWLVGMFSCIIFLVGMLMMMCLIIVMFLLLVSGYFYVLSLG